MDGRVKVEYIKGESISSEVAEAIRLESMDRRAERLHVLAAWLIDRERLVEIERAIDEIDRAYEHLSEIAMLATGFHKPGRSRWRKRRTMTAETDQTTGIPATMPTARQIGDLLDQVERATGHDEGVLSDRLSDLVAVLLRSAKGGDGRAMEPLRTLLTRRPDHFGKLRLGAFAIKSHAMAVAGRDDLFLRDVFAREIEGNRDELAGPGASPLERSLAERVSLASFEASHRDIAALEAELNNEPDARQEFLGKQRDRANARFLAAAKSFAVVQRLAMPVLKMRIRVSEGDPTTSLVGCHPVHVEQSLRNQIEATTDETN